MIDSYYTPTGLASCLVKYVQKKNINSIADFCVGDGMLLRAAQKRWPKAHYSGIDISNKTILMVKAAHPDWNLNKCNFLNELQRKRCNVLKKKRGFDLILLNPPFSCIGGTLHEVELDEKKYSASTAMAFLVESIKHLTPNGCLYAILPVSIAYSQKDQKLWEYLVSNYRLTVLEVPKGNYFKDCSPNIILVSIKDKPVTSLSLKFNSLSLNIKKLSIFRGKISMHTIPSDSKKGNLLIHSTNLQNNKIVNLTHKVENKYSQIKGPALLIQRVGIPNVKKICTISRNDTYVLSDCVIAIKTSTQKELEDLNNLFIKNIEEIADLYKGTGAHYITLQRLEQYLGSNKK